MPDVDWNREAALSAVHVTEHMFEAHRGAIPWRVMGYSVVFGNDGYTPSSSFRFVTDPEPSEPDLRAQKEVEIVRGYLSSFGIKEMGFGLDDEGYSWAMIVNSTDTSLLHNVVFVAWGKACDPDLEIDPREVIVTGVQGQIALGVTMSAPASDISPN
jgi:hypothetical protein